MNLERDPEIAEMWEGASERVRLALEREAQVPVPRALLNKLAAISRGENKQARVFRGPRWVLVGVPALASLVLLVLGSSLLHEKRSEAEMAFNLRQSESLLREALEADDSLDSVLGLAAEDLSGSAPPDLDEELSLIEEELEL